MKYNLAASFQNTINKILYKKTKIAIEMFRKKTKAQNVSLIVAGGVAEICRSEKFKFYYRKMNFKISIQISDFGDNAAMIAWAGIKRFKKIY